MQLSPINHNFQTKNSPQFGSNDYTQGEEEIIDTDFRIIENPSAIMLANRMTPAQKVIIEAGNLAADPVSYFGAKAFEKINNYMDWLSASQIAQIFTALAVFSASTKTGASAKVVKALDNIIARVESLKPVKKANGLVAKAMQPIAKKIEQIITTGKNKLFALADKHIEKPENIKAFQENVNSLSNKAKALANKIGLGSKQQAKRTTVSALIAIPAGFEAGDRLKALETQNSTPEHQFI